MHLHIENIKTIAERGKSMLKLGTEFVQADLPGDELVIYSAVGSAMPVVLSGTALVAFNAFREVAPLTMEEYKRHLQTRGLSSIEIDSTTQWFIHEGLAVEETATAFSFTQVRKLHRRSRLSFWLHLTDRCNLRCSYCYVSKGSQAMSVETLDAFFALLEKECDQNGPEEIHLKFAGGEPLLEFSLLTQIVERAQALGERTHTRMIFSIITNGTVVKPEICRYLSEQGIKISVSLDGLGDYNAARAFEDGHPSISYVLRGISTLLEHNIHPYILTVVSNTNVRGLDDLLEFLTPKDLGIDLILCRDVDEATGDLQLNLDLMHQVLLPTVHRWVQKPLDQLPRLSVSTVNLRGRRERACAAGKSYFSIGPNGCVGACQMTLDNPLVPSLNQVQRFQDVSCLHKACMCPSSCSGCVWRHACAGGCEVLAQRTSLTTPPLCSIMKPLLQELLYLEGRRIQSERKE
jgi:uncharacterized protein